MTFRDKHLSRAGDRTRTGDVAAIVIVTIASTASIPAIIEP
jgi:hypothetical protein